jgi:superfamily II DNA/RNA helicase
MGAKGKAVSFVTREEGKLLTEIEKMINREIVECGYPGFTPSPPPKRPAFVALSPGEALAARMVTSGAPAEDEGQRRSIMRRYKPARRRR